ncbi:MAG TPA: retroviral-like aspartic protease family protein [Acetobacteraceae bacterium]|nr:retroviral-like aspartic protease family protein [Acetobacteraceae bacterium]
MRLLLLIVLAGLPGWQGIAHAACELQERAAVSFTLINGHLLVPLTVNGIAASFVLDTGAERSLVTPAAVRRLDLALDQWVGTTMRGVGGVVEHQNADPRSLSLGGVALRRRTITHDTSLTVGALPEPGAGAPIDGLLGRDFLSVFDLQFDMAAHRLTLFHVQGCRGRFLPWTQPYAVVPADTPMVHALILPITLDAHRLTALLDTGASESMVTLPGMIRLGLTPALLAGDPAATVRGIGRQAPEMRRHRFASLQIGSETLRNPVLWVAPVRVVPIVDALLGADWLAMQRRVWISFAASQVFFVRR